jgi:hypothetical protein
MHAINGGKRIDVNGPGFARLCDDVFQPRRLTLARPRLHVLAGGRAEPLRRGCGRRAHLRLVASDRR